MFPVEIRLTKNTSDKDWLGLRFEFIPETPFEQQQLYLKHFAEQSVDFCAFVANTADGKAAGFSEVAVRGDYVNGCQNRPALFLEGIYVRPEFRGQGIARQLCAAAETWGQQNGCQEFASDVYVEDETSLAAHVGLGFKETERVVYFRKTIRPEKQG
jgi:aminoglycoside 6'-N-acetyltransferase I